MKRMRVVVMSAAAAIIGGTKAPAEANGRTVDVYVANEHTAMEAALFAKAQAAKMFARIGIRIRWHSGRPATLAGNAIVVEIVEHDSGTECPGALACATPFEGTHIRVFYDRLRTKVGKDLVPPLLGHVFVHEITHILQGTDRHSDRGVMKAEWTVMDFEQMRSRTLPFTETDVILIETGLAAEKAHDSSRDLLEFR